MEEIIKNMDEEQMILLRTMQIALDYFFKKYNFSKEDKKNLLINCRIKAIKEKEDLL